MCCHSIQLDPRDRERMYVGITAAGVFRSDDGGESWTPVNKNVEAEFLADPRSEVGQCPHKLLLHPARPERLWQQNHYGVYLSDDQGDSWVRLDGNGLPSGFGFPLMLDPKDPDRAFVIPEKSPEYHYSSGGQLAVYRTRDSGETWELMADGLPKQAWAAVLREASAYDAESLYFGTQSGSLFALTDGELWVEAVRHLPPILSVEVATVVRVAVPSMLAAQAEGRKGFDVEAETVGRGAARASGSRPPVQRARCAESPSERVRRRDGRA